MVFYTLALGLFQGRGFFVCSFYIHLKGVDTMIQIENLTKIFETKSGNITALSGVSLHIKKGDICGIIGMSGAGKSTLLRCLSILETPTSGQITINGQNIHRLKGVALLNQRREIGVVFQGYHLLQQSNVFDNIAFPLTLTKTPAKEIEMRVSELLELVSLSDKRAAYPSQLSGGQMQRVAIARALATSPSVLLCDEPTSALDSFTTKSILSLLKDINKKLGVTIVLITHEIGVVKSICNRVAVIDNASFVEEGSTEAIFTSPEADITKLLLGREVSA